MIYFEITDKKDEIIFSNITENDANLFRDDKNSKKDNKRSYFNKSAKPNELNIWIITDDKDLYKSSKSFHKFSNICYGVIIGL